MSHDAHHEEGWFKKYCWSTDHKIIGFQYLFTGMALAVLGGFFAYAFRMQLGFPGKAVPGFGVVSPNEYNALVTNHGTIMIFWVAMPVLIAAFGNFLIPLMIGCDERLARAKRSCEAERADGGREVYGSGVMRSSRSA